MRDSANFFLLFFLGGSQIALYSVGEKGSATLEEFTESQWKLVKSLIMSKQAGGSEATEAPSLEDEMTPPPEDNDAAESASSPDFHDDDTTTDAPGDFDEDYPDYGERGVQSR